MVGVVWKVQKKKKKWQGEWMWCIWIMHFIRWQVCLMFQLVQICIHYDVKCGGRTMNWNSLIILMNWKVISSQLMWCELLNVPTRRPTCPSIYFTLILYSMEGGLKNLMHPSIAIVGIYALSMIFISILCMWHKISGHFYCSI